MSAHPQEPLVRRRMSWEEYLRLPEYPNAEWVDGEAVIQMVPNNFDHGSAATALATLLGPLFPEHFLVSEVGLWLPRNRLRGPDLMLVRERPEGIHVTTSPLMVVEILSPSTRSEDTVRKSMEYAEGGVGQYWIVDPDLRTIDVLRNVDGAWDVVAHLDDDRPTAEIDLDGVDVPLDLRSILRG